jgi:DNA-binding FadR family transcriptional regulator
MSTDPISEFPFDEVLLGDRLAQHLASEVARRVYRSGDQLPPETALAKHYHVSKPTMRQALQKLAGLGMVRIQHGRRTEVLDESNWDVLDPVIQRALTAAGRKEELCRHFWEVREMLEVAAAGHAARRASAEDLDQLDSAARELRTIANTSQDLRRFLEIDRLFHDVVTRASGNPALRSVLTPVHTFLNNILWEAESRVQAEQLVQLAEQHGRIASAIRGHDPAAARQAMAEHISFAEQEEFPARPNAV